MKDQAKEVEEDEKKEEEGEEVVEPSEMKEDANGHPVAVGIPDQSEEIQVNKCTFALLTTAYQEPVPYMFSICRLQVQSL